MEFLGKSLELDCGLDIIFYNTLLSRYLDHGWSMNILWFLTDMMKRRIEPDACKLTLIIHSMFLAGKLHLERYMINDH